jgi:hypothetical protein
MSDVDDIVRVYAGSVPPDVMVDVGADVAYAIATVLAAAKAEADRLFAGAVLGTAVGDFLDLHARDRGLRRQDGETDDQLRERLRTPPKAGTVSAIGDAVQQIVGDVVTVGPVLVIEIPRQGWFFDKDSALFDVSYRVQRTGLNPVYCSNRFGGGRGVVVVLIPAAADAVAAVTDAVRTKVSGGKLWLVQEYTLS